MTDAGPGSQDAAPGRLDERILDFTRTELGPASERAMRPQAARRAVRDRMQAGQPIEDAVLGQIHSRIGDDRRLADEFAAYFLFDLMKMGKLSMSSTSRLRRFLDTGDLVLSVFGDLWEGVESLQFESRGQFKALFAKRLDWKAADQARRMDTGTRREDRRVDASASEFEQHAAETETAPVPGAIRREERERLILILLRLKERERRLLTMHLKGMSIEGIAEAMELQYDTARKALSRAIAQARQLAAFGAPHPG
ncbi:MAG: sigma-70 family RNA polymerase sigma factor [Planctomycetota bacterium]|jgi:RNA polymerase sigma factor (sigma-70 family)